MCVRSYMCLVRRNEEVILMDFYYVLFAVVCRIQIKQQHIYSVPLSVCVSLSYRVEIKL